MLVDDTLEINVRIKDYMKIFDDFLKKKLITNDSETSRIQRFKKEFMPENGCDSEEEEKLSYNMFFQDLKDLRRIVSDQMMECFTGQIACEKEFAK